MNFQLKFVLLTEKKDAVSKNDQWCNILLSLKTKETNMEVLRLN